MAAVDMMRHWGKRPIDGLDNDSDDELSAPRCHNRRLATIIEEESSLEIFAKDHEEEERPKRSNEVYGRDDSSTSSEEEDSEDDSRNDDLSNDGRGPPGVKKSFISEPRLSEIVIGNRSVSQGMYRTVSVFGGIFDIADPVVGDDSDSMSSDSCFSDDFTPEEVSRTIKSTPSTPIMSKNEQRTTIITITPEVPSNIAFKSALNALDDTERLVNAMLMDLESMNTVAETIYNEASSYINSSNETIGSIFLGR
jgi:hypothetical protein